MRRSLVAAALLLALISTACKAEAKVIVDIAGDQSADVAVEFALDDELKGLLEQGGGSFNPEDLGVLPPNLDIEESRRGDFTVYSALQSVEDTAGLPDLLAEAGGDQAVFDTFTVDVDASGGRLDASVSVVAPDFGDLGIPTGVLTSDILTSELHLRMPGEVDMELTNADRILDDGTMVWDLPIEGGDLVVTAVTQTAPTENSFLRIGFLAAVVVAGVLVGWWLARRNRNRDDGAELISQLESPEPPGTFD